MADGLLWAILLLPVSVAAQQETESALSNAHDPQELTVESVEALRAGVARQLESPELRASDAPLLRELERLYVRQIDALREAAELSAELEKRRTSELTGVTSDLRTLRALDDTARAVELQAALGEELNAALDASRAAIEEAERDLGQRERERRRVREQLDGNGTAEAKAALAAELTTCILQSKVASARLAAARLERQGVGLRQQIQEIDEARARATLEQVEGTVKVSEDEVTEILGNLQKNHFDLERALESARLDLGTAERNHAAAQARIGEAASSDALARVELAARRAVISAAQRRVAILQEEIARTEQLEETWRRRFDLRFGRTDRATERAWLEEARTVGREFERDRHIRNARVSELRGELAALPAGTGPAQSPQDEGYWVRAKSAAIADLIALNEADLGQIATASELQERLIAELEDRIGSVPWSDRLRDVAGYVTAVWTFEIMTADDRPITVGKIVWALLALGLGLYLARAATAMLGRRVLPRLNLDEGASKAFESLAFYALVVVVFVTVLRAVNIPLTAFTVVGGALAIGFGFGSQNVVSNFISGIILLVERPIKIGDLIEVGDIYGNIERIGLRSTRVRTGGNIHIIVPNASFLESQVINWTHNNDNVRIKVTVGVVYGAPTREVSRIIGEVLAAHPAVHRSPAPQVLFVDFGDNALIFEAHFWVRVRNQMSRLSIESDVRFEIDDRFREAGIVIAFPQRDVHLDTLSPLEVRLTRPGGEGNEG